MFKYTHSNHIMSDTITSIILCVGTSLCLHYLYQQVKYRSFKGPFPLPLFGNIYDPSLLCIIKYLHSCIHRYGSIFLFWVGMKPTVVVCDPVMVRKILVDTKTFVKGPDYTEKFSLVFGQGLVTSNGAKHKEDRACLGRFFTKVHIEKYHKMICETTDKMIEEEIVPHLGKIMDIQDFFHILSLRIFGKFSMGIDYSQPKYKAIAKNLNKGVKEGSSIIGKHIIFNIPMFSFIPSIYKVKQIVSFVDEHIKDIIAQRMNCMEKKMALKDDLLSALLHQYKEKQEKQENIETKENDLTFVYDHIRTSLAAGHDTTAFFGCYMAFLLAKHPEVQDKIRNEIKSQLTNTTYIDEEAMSKLPYCRCVLQEVLRLYTIIPFVNRTTIKDYKIEDTNQTIPAHTTILLPLSIMNRSKHIWKNQNEFIPERFVDIQGHNNAQKGYLPFGYGTRSCIGANLAMTEGIIMMVKLVSQFQFYPDETFKPHIIAGISLISKNGIHVRLEPIVH
jgi:cytochrome P450